MAAVILDRYVDDICYLNWTSQLDNEYVVKILNVWYNLRYIEDLSMSVGNNKVDPEIYVKLTVRYKTLEE